MQHRTSLGHRISFTKAISIRNVLSILQFTMIDWGEEGFLLDSMADACNRILFTIEEKMFIFLINCK